ncbi:hypothetical protein [Deinococcus altitudinis]|uniref:hypothetical protein n=1 Tax=Deinococcus altitudinis TaxID=468914 RepID=UPI00389130C2
MPSSARASSEGNANLPNAVMAGARAVLLAYRTLAILELGESLTSKERSDVTVLLSLLYGIGSALLMHDHPPSDVAPPEIRERFQSFGNDPTILKTEAYWMLLNAVHLLPHVPSRAGHCLIMVGRLLNKLSGTTFGADSSYPSVHRYRPMGDYDRLVYLTLYALASSILPGVGPHPAVPAAAHWSQLIDLWKLQLVRQNGIRETRPTEWAKLDAVATEYPAATGLELCKILNTRDVVVHPSVHRFTMALIKALGALQLQAPAQTNFQFFPELPPAR